MKSLRHVATIVLLLIICNLGDAKTFAIGRLTHQSAANPLANTQWRLVSIVSRGRETPSIEGTTVTLRFGADGRVGGSGGCNSFRGDYRVQDETIRFSQVISTRRACLNQSANQQEQRFFGELALARTFRVTENRLAIFGGGIVASGLNLVMDSPEVPANGRYEDLTTPVSLLTSFYDAVNAKDYERAYRYWETPTSRFEDFRRGYADTESVRLIVEPPMRIEGAAGSSFAEVPTLLVVRRRDGRERFFVGCYTVRRSNVRQMDGPRDVWRIYRASLTPAFSDASISRRFAQSCGN